MRKRINNSKDSRPSGDGQKPFRRASNKPEGESRFSKPSIKKSSLRVVNSAPASDKPASFRPRAFDKDNKSRDFRTDDRSGKEGFEKPRFDRPRFDKPGIGKPRSSDNREFKPRQDRSDKPAYGDQRNERPRYSDRDDTRSFKPKSDFTPRERGSREDFDRPRTERSAERPALDKPRSFDRERAPRDFKPRGESGSTREGAARSGFDKPRTYGRDADPRDFKRDSDRSTGRSEKPAFKKKDDPLTSEERAANLDNFSEEAANRRVGRFETAPHYKLGTYAKKIGLTKPKSDTDERRLNRYIANAGVCSRREADDLIAAGQISVNGKVITEMGYKVSPADVVKYGKKVLNPEKFVYVLINKPKDYITTTDDPEERKTVLDLIKGACSERIYPVGRLDRNTTGLLLMTNDGELAKKLTHPSGGIKKIYQAELDKPITTEDFEKLQAGVALEDGFIRPDEVGIVTPDAMVVGLEIHSGHNRVVRRMFEHLGYEVQKLDRTVFAGLDKKDLPRGKWRFLSEKEVVKLKYMM
jgi:23S rRNA pseudouridine2605 synthase